MSLEAFSPHRMAASLASACSDMASSLSQRQSDPNIAARPLALLSYPTSLIGNTATLTLGALSCMSLGAAFSIRDIAAKKTKECRPLGSPFLIHFAPTYARLQMVIGRILAPYPYRSVQKIVTLLIDQSIYSSKRLLEKYNATHTLADVIKSDIFEIEVNNIFIELEKEKPRLLELVQYDIDYAKNSNRPDEERRMLARLKSTLENGINSQSTSKPIPSIREQLINTLIYLIRDDESYKLVNEASYALSKMIQMSDDGNYASELTARIEKCAASLFHDERAARYLGNGNTLQGRMLFLQLDKKAVLFAAIYAAIDELTENSSRNCLAINRRIKLTNGHICLNIVLEGRPFEKNDEFDEHLQLTRRVFQYFERIPPGYRFEKNELEEFAAWIALDTINGNCLKLPYFDLTANGSAVRELDRLTLTLARAK